MTELKLIATFEPEERLEGLRPYRIALYHGWNDGQWVSWRECGPDEVNPEGRDRMFGHYYRTEKDAFEDFLERTGMAAKAGMGSEAAIAPA